MHAVGTLGNEQPTRRAQRVVRHALGVEQGMRERGRVEVARIVAIEVVVATRADEHHRVVERHAACIGGQRHFRQQRWDGAVACRVQPQLLAGSQSQEVTVTRAQPVARKCRTDVEHGFNFSADSRRGAVADADLEVADHIARQLERQQIGARQRDVVHDLASDRDDRERSQAATLDANPLASGEAELVIRRAQDTAGGRVLTDRFDDRIDHVSVSARAQRAQQAVVHGHADQQILGGLGGQRRNQHRHAGRGLSHHAVGWHH